MIAIRAHTQYIHTYLDNLCQTWTYGRKMVTDFRNGNLKF